MKKLTAKNFNIVQENAILYLNFAIVYLNYHKVSNDKFRGRVEQCGIFLQLCSQEAYLHTMSLSVCT